MFEVKLFPEFSWSLTRHKTLMDCGRKYAHEYYTSHNGWLRDASQESKQAYRLKKLTTFEMYFGTIVHEIINETIEYFLRTSNIPTEEQLNKRLRFLLNKGYIETTKKQDEWHQKPNKFTMFQEIYYNEGPVDEKIDEIQSRLNVVMKHFLSSKTFTDIRQKDRMKFVEAERFRHFDIHNIKTIVVMDFLYKDLRNNKWIIADWKTGKESLQDRYQLALYAMYIQEKFNIPTLDEITIRNEYLLTGTHKEYQLNEIDIKNVQELFGLSIQEMMKYLDDPANNKPLPLEDFSRTDNEKNCKRCKYKEICF